MKKSKDPGTEILQNLVNRGLTNAQIGQMYGVMEETVRNWIDRAKIIKNTESTISDGNIFWKLYTKECQNIAGLAEAFGVPVEAAKEWMFGIVPDRKQAKLPEKEILEEMHLYKNLSVKEIADQFHVSPGTICRWLRYYQIPRRGNSLRSKSPGLDELRRLYIDERREVADIAEKYGVTEQRVRNWLSKAGLHRNRSGKCPEKEELERLYISKILRRGKLQRYMVLPVAWYRCGPKNTVCIKMRNPEENLENSKRCPDFPPCVSGFSYAILCIWQRLLSVI